MKKEFVINSQDEINLILDEIFSEIKIKKIVLLEGELGAGKTTFVKYLAKRLNIKENINSPSFNFMKTYNGLIHLDLYNYKGHIDEFIPYFEDNVVVLEWSNLFKLPFKHFVLIKIQSFNDEINKRKFLVTVK
ncbi:tRNA (adenosine(37)-N6)-threonylcarbamoyltransferase complex ATPase subunit type 1 TsaE [Mycoplasmopsis synoviae]|uniref:tRNA threonylcarbamoyladenosine biosynthesis protein TsaE n=2 Tax=Mycoplasmopsis synoviae TaxID=2109 RepID=Q4A736_MYCS5|nr:tRNA (adenosine(37)-N6)-threonylcarbamoyltransferase complex ATPase subunit type 1 TsaE [Mycoplasmopsis synoviae]AAZ43435.1 conserved hypothetical protein [Mycoplasmopsis synoviae 53]AKB10800.1 ATPase [Mycoplasmopsis synoviae ATCC 25204]AKJ20936.1 TsaE protein, required for threonylcarbamoyladenosine t(6)A37 formation in tRNA [Mycoplasmopsis synoviae]AQU48269.1 TsaE protein, required for threonylcarbamoyladenosine t(6)A37 formation in tRNA [Mycoplasmopsis synoviae]AWL83858.1 tRNA (adenosine